MTDRQMSPTVPYKGGPDERFWYAVGEFTALIHLLVLGTFMIMSGMIPSNDLCAATSIRTWEYWSLYGDKGLTILALGWFYSLLWRTLWRWWYGPTFIFTVLCGALHTFCAIWYIQYNNDCSANLQCWGGCNPAPNPGPTGYWIAWWTLTGVVALCCFLEAVIVLGIGRFTTVMALLLWSYGSNAGPFNYYERFQQYRGSPLGLPYGAPSASKAPSDSIDATSPSAALLPKGQAAGAPVNTFADSFGDNDFERHLAFQATLPAGATVVGGLELQ